MKKILAFAAMAVMALGAFAQDMYVGGQVGFWRNSGDNETSFQILPEIGFNLSVVVEPTSFHFGTISWIVFAYFV